MPTITSSCDTSTIFSGSLTAGASVIVNNIQLVPSPFVNLAVEKYKVGEIVIGGVLKLTLNGTIFAGSFNDVVEGGTTTNIKDILELAQNKNCVCVEIKCSSVLINGPGRIVSVSVSEGNQPTWVNVAPYSIEIELYTNSISLNDDRVVIPDIYDTDNTVLKSISENLSWSINDDTFNWGSVCSGSNPTGIDGFGNRHIKVSFDISAIGVAGISGCSTGSGTYYYGLEAAEKYLVKRLTGLQTKATDSLFNLGALNDAPKAEIISAFDEYTGGNTYLDFRTIQIDPVELSINISGEIIYRPTGCLNPDVFTTLNVEHNLTTSDESVTINGSIIGLVDNDFTNIIKLNANQDRLNDCAYKSKMDKAEAFLSQMYNPSGLKSIAMCYAGQSPYPSGFIQDNCQYSIGTGCSSTSSGVLEICDMRLVSSQISRNISAGEINFTFNLSNAPNCDILGASKVDVNVTHDKPHDNIVEIIIPGRGSLGPIIQNLCCNSSEKYDITVDAMLNRKTCNFDIKKDTIDALRKCAEDQVQNLINNYGVDINCWFKVNDTETIGNTSYKLNRSYVKPSCP